MGLAGELTFFRVCGFCDSGGRHGAPNSCAHSVIDPSKCYTYEQEGGWSR